MKRAGWRRLARLLILAAAVAAAIGYFAWSRAEERRAVEELTPAERRAAFQHSVESFRRLCLEHGAALDTHCREQRALIELFPECDAACRELLAKSERPPTR